MTDRELDAKCAEIVGWTDIHKVVPEHREIGIPPLMKKADSMFIPPFSTSLDAARELLEWANKSDEPLRHKFMAIIYETMTNQKFGEKGRGIVQFIDLMLATPRQICESFVECFGGHDDR